SLIERLDRRALSLVGENRVGLGREQVANLFRHRAVGGIERGQRIRRRRLLARDGGIGRWRGDRGVVGRRRSLARCGGAPPPAAPRPRSPRCRPARAPAPVAPGRGRARAGRGGGAGPPAPPAPPPAAAAACLGVATAARGAPASCAMAEAPMGAARINARAVLAKMRSKRGPLIWSPKNFRGTRVTCEAHVQIKRRPGANLTWIRLPRQQLEAVIAGEFGRFWPVVACLQRVGRFFSQQVSPDCNAGAFASEISASSPSESTF